MAETEFVDNYKNNFLGHWTKITQIKKPVIAAVNGIAVYLFLLVFFFDVAQKLYFFFFLLVISLMIPIRL